MKKRLGLIVVGLAFLMLLFLISNPSQDRHSGKLSTTTGIPTMEEVAPGERAPYIKTSAMRYHSYFLFSTCTHAKSGGVITLGFLWMVFDLQAGKTSNS